MWITAFLLYSHKDSLIGKFNRHVFTEIKKYIVEFNIPITFLPNSIDAYDL